MGLETFGFIDDLVPANPLDADSRTQGNEHINGIKQTLQDTFTAGATGLTGAVVSTHTELNLLSGVTALATNLLSLAGNGSGNTNVDLDVYDRVYITNVTAAITLTFTNVAAGKEFTLYTAGSVSKAITYSGATMNGFQVATGSTTPVITSGMFIDGTTCYAHGSTTY